MASLYKNVHAACLNKCLEDNGIAATSVQEGTCLRNCAQKLSSYYPTLRQNLQNAEFREVDAKTGDLLRKNNMVDVNTAF